MASKTETQKENQMPVHDAMMRSIEMAYSRFKTGTTNTPIGYVISTPGAGKTQLHKKLCSDLGYGQMSITMGLLPLEHMSGLPTVMDIDNELDLLWNPAGKKVHWLPPQMISDIQKLGREHEFSVVLLDDFHLCTPGQQSYGFEIFSHHTLQGYPFPKNVQFIAAGNATSAAGAKVTLSAIVNRMLPIRSYSDREYWLENYAIPNKINKHVLSFLRHSSNAIYFAEPESNTPFGSPRSWSGLASAMDVFEESNSLSTNTLKCITDGLVSHTASTNFYLFYEVYNKVPVEKIYSTGNYDIPNDNNKYPFTIAITDFIISKIIDFANNTKYGQADRSVQTKETTILKNYIKIYNSIIKDLSDTKNNELATLSAYMVFKHNHVFEISPTSHKTMWEMCIILISNNILDPKILNLVKTSKTKMGEELKAIAESIQKV